MGEHNVVITCFRSGTYGPSAAAQMVTNMVRTFRNSLFGLLVGVGGGASKPPNSEDATKDIRLGDVVVGDPKGKYSKAVPGTVPRSLQLGLGHTLMRR